MHFPSKNFEKWDIWPKQNYPWGFNKQHSILGTWLCIQTCNHARTVLCITSWIVNKRPRTSSCSSIIALVLSLIRSSNCHVASPLKCWRSSNTISSLACSDHFTLITSRVKIKKSISSQTQISISYTDQKTLSKVELCG